ncbi:hypothetical protein Pmani_020587 [Petrolisthes manimaculis]|uniref:Reverse transcriptase domain-containing protein n=1 Tax=Petrolisthes manimaculis TaxID=1843537 RepID=A0AAE1PI93_9EUCA|nr:hypothetical protein Pmani_020587 [Petrolisthes manimaculis]
MPRHLTLPHMRLLTKLPAYGITIKQTENLKQWIKNFLTGRKQSVKINGEISDSVNVPQGSVMGPLMSILFVNDLPDNLHNPTLMYADDTKMFSIKKQRLILDPPNTTTLQQDLTRFQSWANNMRMKLNPTKFKTMHLGRSNPLQEYTMLLDDNTQHHIMTTTEEKDLGVIVDSGLTFSKYIQTQINKANNVLRAIKHTF